MLNVAASTPVQPDTPTDKQTIDSLGALQLHGLGLLGQRVRDCVCVSECMCHRQEKQAIHGFGWSVVYKITGLERRLCKRAGRVRKHKKG